MSATSSRRRLTLTGSTLRPRPPAYKGRIARNWWRRSGHCWRTAASACMSARTPAGARPPAHAVMDANEQIGKVVLTVSDTAGDREAAPAERGVMPSFPPVQSVLRALALLRELNRQRVTRSASCTAHRPAEADHHPPARKRSDRQGFGAATPARRLPGDVGGPGAELRLPWRAAGDRGRAALGDRPHAQAEVAGGDGGLQEDAVIVSVSTVPTARSRPSTARSACGTAWCRARSAAPTGLVSGGGARAAGADAGASDRRRGPPQELAARGPAAGPLDAQPRLRRAGPERRARNSGTIAVPIMADGACWRRWA